MLRAVRRVGERGDTILEVLIAIAVVSSVLGSVFVLANRTSQNSRQAQEHQEALKHASSQIELLSEYLRQPGTAQPTGSSFCMQQTVLQPLDYTGAAPGQCQVNTGNYQYSLKISYDAANEVYIATVTWPGPTGGTDSISLAYRTHGKTGSYSENEVTAALPPSPPPAGPPSCAVRYDIVLVLDVSNSMATNGWPEATRLNALRTVANYFVDNSSVHGSGNHEGIVAFNDNATITQSLTSSISALHTGVQAAYDYSNSGTHYVPGLQRGMEVLTGPAARGGSPKVMIFMSDGNPNDAGEHGHDVNGPSATMAYSYINANIAPQGVRLYTVSINETLGVENPILQNMVRNGGTYAGADSYAEFQGIFQSLAAELDCV